MCSYDPRQQSSTQSTKASNPDGFSLLQARKLGKWSVYLVGQKTRAGLLALVDWVDDRCVRRNTVNSSIYQTNSKNTKKKKRLSEGKPELLNEFVELF